MSDGTTKAIRTLIIEDDRVNMMSLQRTLQKSPISFTEIASADRLEDGLMLAQKNKFDVIFLDLNLPDSNDMETVKRTLEACPHTAIIVVTASEDDFGPESVGEGVQEYLKKGEFDIKDATQAIRYAIERKKGEEALKESEIRYRMFFEEAKDAIFIADTETGSMIDCNKAAMELLEKDKSEIIGTKARDFYPENLRNEADRLFENAMRSKDSSFIETQVITKSGKLKDVAIKSNIFRIDGKEVMQGIFRDITKQKKAQKEVQYERNKAQKYLDTAGVMLLIVGIDEKVKLINRKGYSILGYEKGEVIGKNWTDNFVPEANRQETKGTFKNLIQNPEKFEYYEDSVLTKKGGRRLIAWHNVPLYDDKGNPEGILSSGEDITLRNQVQKAMRKAYHDLEKAHQELKEMQGQLVQQEKMASIGLLAAGVAHEMNTPIGFVDSNFHTLKNYMTKILELLELYKQLVSAVEIGDKQQRLNTAEKIKASKEELKIDYILEDIQALFDESEDGLERVSAIVQNLKDFSRIDRAEEFEEYNINDGIKSTLVMAKNEIKYDSDVKTELAELPMIYCNSGQINQVILNITLNAAQAILSQEREDRGHILIKTYASQEDVICEITDDGPGIAPEILDKIFDPFFTTKEPGKGTGLGLGVSYDIIVTKHNGQLLVESSPDEGAKFTIKLPRSLTRRDIKADKDKEGELENEKANSIIC